MVKKEATTSSFHVNDVVYIDTTSGKVLEGKIISILPHSIVPFVIEVHMPEFEYIVQCDKEELHKTKEEAIKTAYARTIRLDIYTRMENAKTELERMLCTYNDPDYKIDYSGPISTSVNKKITQSNKKICRSIARLLKHINATEHTIWDIVQD